MRQLKIYLLVLLVFNFWTTACAGRSENQEPAAVQTTPTEALSTPTEVSETNLPTETTVPAEDTPTPTAKPQPTATTDPRNATDNPGVNATIAALLDKDTDTLLDLILLNSQPCTTQDGLGGPPKCPPGVNDGTVLSFLPVSGPGEGSHLDPNEVSRVFDYEEPVLFAVVLVQPPEIFDPVFPAGKYAVILHTQPRDFARTFRLNDQGQIIMVEYTAWSAEEELTYIAGEILYQR